MLYSKCVSIHVESLKGSNRDGMRKISAPIFAGIPWSVMVADDPIVPWWLKAAVFCLLGGILVVPATLGLIPSRYKY